MAMNEDNFKIPVNKFIDAVLQRVLPHHMSSFTCKTLLEAELKHNLKVGYFDLIKCSDIIYSKIQHKKPKLLGAAELIKYRELLGELAYYKQAQIWGYNQTIQPPKIALSKRRQTMTDFEEYFSFDLEHYDATSLYKKYKLNMQKLCELTSQFFIWGHSMDPMPQWYEFIKNVRINDFQFFQKSGGDILRAHDYYIIAELFDALINDVDPQVKCLERLTDGGQNNWRYSSCKNCNNQFKKTDYYEEFCNECKNIKISGSSATVKCSECGAGLIKLIDGNKIIDNVFRKNKAKETNIQTNRFNLKYGMLEFSITCTCGAVTSDYFFAGKQ